MSGILVGALIVLAVVALTWIAVAYGKAQARKDTLSNTIKTGKAVRDALDAVGVIGRAERIREGVRHCRSPPAAAT